MRSAKLSALDRIVNWTLTNIGGDSPPRSKKKTLKRKKINFDKPAPSAPLNNTQSLEALNIEQPSTIVISSDSDEPYLESLANLDLSYSEIKTDKNLLYDFIDLHKSKMAELEAIKNQAIKRIPTLTSDRSTFDQFIACCTEIISSIESDIHKNEILKYLIVHKSSSEAFQKIQNINFNGFQDFKDKILKALFPNETSNVLHASLKTIKQGENESNIQYIDRFNIALNRLKNVLENNVKSSVFFTNDVRKTFITNLKPQTRLLAAIKAESPLEEIINFIISNEDIQLNQNNVIEEKLDQILAVSSSRKNNNSNNPPHFVNKNNRNSNYQKSFQNNKNFQPRCNNNNCNNRNFNRYPQNHNNNNSQNYFQNNNSTCSNYNCRNKQFNNRQNFRQNHTSKPTR
jgi:hypothetical protein